MTRSCRSRSATALFGVLQEPICQGITWVTAGAESSFKNCRPREPKGLSWPSWPERFDSYFVILYIKEYIYIWRYFSRRVCIFYDWIRLGVGVGLKLPVSGVRRKQWQAISICFFLESLGFLAAQSLWAPSLCTSTSLLSWPIAHFTRDGIKETKQIPIRIPYIRKLPYQTLNYLAIFSFGTLTCTCSTYLCLCRRAPVA